MRKKVCNFRFFPIATVFSLLGILCGRYYSDTLFVVIFVTVAIGILALLPVFFFDKIKFGYVIAFVVLFSGFSLYSAGTIMRAERNEIEEYGEFDVRICYVSMDGETIRATVDGFSGKANVYFDDVLVDSYGYDPSNLRPGDQLSVVARIKSVDWEKYGINTSYFVKKVRYSLSVSSVESQERGRATLPEKIQTRVTELAVKYTGKDLGEVCVALLLGDKNAMSDDVRESFSRSGLAHVLAVSGLHISVLCYAVTFLFKKFFVPRRITFAVLAVFLTVYCFACDLSPSVIRASIMSLAVIPPKFRHDDDTLSVMSLVAIIIFLINPMYLYDVGFLMSFAAVLGIVLLAPVIGRSKLLSRLPDGLAKIITTTLSVNITVLPVIASVFGSISLLSVVSNLAVIPIMTVGFSMFFFFALLGLLFPWLEFLFYSGNILAGYIKAVSDIVSGISFSAVDFGMKYAILPYYAGVFVISDYVFVSPRTKKVVAVALVILLAVLYICRISGYSAIT